MDMGSVKRILANKITALNDAMTTAHSLGNLEEFTRLEGELDETQGTLDRLKEL